MKRIHGLSADSPWREVAATVAGLAMPLAFAPFSYWPVALFAVGLLAVVTRVGTVRRTAARFYLFGAGLFLTGVSWVYVSITVYGGTGALVGGLLAVLMALGLALFLGLQGYVYARFLRGWLWPAGFVFAFALQEWLRGWLLTGFPWLWLGYAYTDTWLAGLGPVVGVYGMGVAAAGLSALLACAALYRGQWAGRALTLGCVAGIACGAWGVGKLRFVEPTGEVLTVSAIQGNVDQAVKWETASIQPILHLYRDMSRTEWGRDLVVWPEAAITLNRESAEPYLAETNRRAALSGTTLVTGIPDRDESGAYFNAAWALGAGEGVYLKRRLVPFGEYMPFDGLLRGLIAAFDLPMSGNQAGPADQPPLRVAGRPLSMAICYEIVFPGLVRSVKDPALIVTISNDTWFGESIGPKQHMQMARMRAVENGRYLLRSTNNGISAVVDPAGRVIASIPSFEAGVLRGEVRLMEGRTPYAALGDWPLLSLLACVVLVVGFRQVMDLRAK